MFWKKVKRQQNQKRRPAQIRERRTVTAVILITCLLIAGVGYHSYDVFIRRGTTEPSSGRKTTNTGAAVYQTEREMKQTMKWRFPELTELLADSIIVPGLKSTEALQGEFHALSICTSMTPQGMCITEDYIFVSAYCHTHKHNSTLYMISRDTKKLVKTIALGGKAHVGGMAYDPDHRNVWVSGGTKGAAKAIAYSLEDLEAYDISDKKPVKAVFNYTLATIDRNSYMAYDENSLWIGYYTTDGLSQIERFDLREDGGLNSQIIADFDSLHESVPADFIASTSGQVQGAAKNSPYLYLSQSYGINDSALQIFRFNQNSTRFENTNAARVWRFPQKMEQICTYDGKMYCLFESAGHAYSAQPALIIDRILVFNLEDLNPEEEDIIDIADTA